MVTGERFAESAVITMATGCICCKVRGDLVTGLKSLVAKIHLEPQHFDGLLIETSGLSEVNAACHGAGKGLSCLGCKVGPVCQTFFADKFVQRNFLLDAVHYTALHSDPTLSCPTLLYPTLPYPYCTMVSIKEEQGWNSFPFSFWKRMVNSSFRFISSRTSGMQCTSQFIRGKSLALNHF